jgi:hypothetical protein
MDTSNLEVPTEILIIGVRLSFQVENRVSVKMRKKKQKLVKFGGRVNQQISLQKINSISCNETKFAKSRNRF